MAVVAHSIAADLTVTVITGLATALTADDAFNGTTSPEQKTSVTYGFNFGSKSAEQVYLGKMSADTPPAAIRSGRNFRNESGKFDLTVMVRIPGADATQAIERMFAIGHKIEDYLGAKKSGEGLSVAGLQTLVIDSWAADYAGIDSGTGAVLTYSVAWTARLDDTVSD